MKKITAILLCFVMIISYSCMGVFAENVSDGPALEASLTEGSAFASGEGSLDLVINANPGFSVMILTLEYSNENISLKAVDCKVNNVSAEFSNQEGKSTLAFYHLGSDCTEIGALATLTFGVGAFSGEAEIIMSAEVGDICNSEAQTIGAVFTCGKLIVNCISEDHYYVYEGRTEPSCSKKGEIKYVCTVCKKIKITEIETTSHEPRGGEEVVKKPTCDTDGVKAKVCKYCSAWIDAEHIDAPGHNYENSEYIVTKEPTCTDSGSHYRNCLTCGYKEVTPIAPLGHDEGTWRTSYPGDCLNSGVASLYCNRCDEVIETIETPVGRHFMSWVVTKAPTCQEQGKEEYLCLICAGEKTDSKTIPVLEHIPADEIIVRDATCSQAGLAETYCQECDGLISSREIEETAHIKNSLTVITAPTNKNEGAGEYRCKVCSKVLETITLPVTNGVIYIETTDAFKGDSTAVKVYIKNNPGFSVGIIRIKYDEESLIFDGVTAGDINAELIYGVPKSGEISVLVSLENARYTANGLAFNVNFTLTENAADGKLELFYEPQNDFSAENGDRVFFNMESGEIQILEFILGDVDGDRKINTSDLAALKIYLAGSSATVNKGADVDKSGKIDTRDLASLKLHLAGVPQF